MIEKGAYLLRLFLKRSVSLKPGALKRVSLPAGVYIYVGSARRGIAGRIARHMRLAAIKKGKLHWHIDYLLVHPQARIADFQALAEKNECVVSKRLALEKGISAPVPGFGSSDCRSGCKAHLYRVESADPDCRKPGLPNLISPRNSQGEKNG